MQKEVVPRIRKAVTDTIKATYKKIDPNRRHHSFEVGGWVDERRSSAMIL